jgi:hypothetical protein
VWRAPVGGYVVPVSSERRPTRSDDADREPPVHPVEEAEIREGHDPVTDREAVEMARKHPEGSD